MLKQKVDSLATSVASTEQGLAWMSQSSVEQEDAASANSEALKIMQSTTSDAATISELERKIARTGSFALPLGTAKTAMIDARSLEEQTSTTADL